MTYLLSPSTFAITPPHTHTHTHTGVIGWRTNSTVGLRQYFLQIILWYNKILLKFMEIKMNIFFAWLKNIASIILATIVLACRIVLIYRNAVSRYIMLITYPYLPIVQADICRTLFMFWGVINSV